MLDIYTHVIFGTRKKKKVTGPATGDPNMEEIAIETHNLKKQYGQGIVALKDLNIKIKRGQCVGYLGPNGSGKTTTIKILTNLIKPSSGQAFINGIDVTQFPKEALRPVGSLVEVPGIYEYLTAHEMLAYFGKIRKMSKADINRRIKEVLMTVKLSEWEHKKIGSFSTGMLRRLAIGQALLHDPEILILDEPVIGLDPKGMKDIRDIIKKMLLEKKTIFLSSHLLGEVAETCNDVILLDKGVIVSSDSVAHLTGATLGSKIEVSFLKPLTEEQCKTISNFDIIKDVEPMGEQIRIIYDGKPETSSKILSQIIGLGVEVVSFSPQKVSLEDVYVAVMGDERGVS
jgi:ABC-2 type transport system ATP-binding protein